MDNKDPVRNYRQADRDNLNAILGETGLGGGGSDKKTAKAKVKETGDKLDAVKDEYGIGKAAKGPSAFSRLRQTFRSFGAKASALFSPKAQTTPPPTVTQPQQPQVPEPKPSIAQPDPNMAFSRADMRAKANAMSATSAPTRAETLAAAKAQTQEHAATKTQERGIER